jgi:hypothetical protein
VIEAAENFMNALELQIRIKVKRWMEYMPFFQYVLFCKIKLIAIHRKRNFEKNLQHR